MHNLAGQVELARLVDLCAERLDLKIEYDPKILQGATVTLRLREGIRDDELWMVTNHLLSTRGFATVQMPGSELISIIKLSGAQGLARLEPDDFALAQAGYVTILYEMRHRVVKDITTAIQPLLSKPGGAIAALGQTNLVLISDYKARIDQALELIERLDVPADEVVMETIVVEHLAANQLTGLITAAANAYGAIGGRQLKGKLISAPDGGSVVLVASRDEVTAWREMIDRFNTRQALETRSYVPRHFSVQEVASLVEPVARDKSPRGSGDQWEIITDDLTGTLIITATPSEHAAIESLVERLDTVPAAARRPVLRAFPIRNRPVSEILDVLVRLVEAGVIEAGSLQDQGSERIEPVRSGTERNVLLSVSGDSSSTGPRPAYGAERCGRPGVGAEGCAPGGTTRSAPGGSDRAWRDCTHS